MDTSINSAGEQLRAVLRSIRSATPYSDFPRDRAASSDIRTGYLDGNPVRRLVITMRAPGCSWVERGGGCTMCGHFAGTTRGVLPTVEDCISQFTGEIDRYDPGDIRIVSLYNSGSMLDPDEFPFDALRYICRAVSRFPSIEKLVLESRAEYIDRSSIGELLDILGPSRKLSVAVGLETSDDLKRQLCINKGCTRKDIENAIATVGDIAEIQLYILVGIPFLTEREMLDDAVLSIRCASDMGADEIHIEPATIQRYTLTELLYRAGLYRLPSLHTLYEVLKTVVPGIRPYVSPFRHMPDPDIIPSGCPECTGRLIEQLLTRYNISRTPDSLDYAPCTCMDEWRSRLAETDPRPLAERIQDALESCFQFVDGIMS